MMYPYSKRASHYLKIITAIFVAVIAGQLTTGNQGYGFVSNAVSSYKYDQYVKEGWDENKIGFYYGPFGYPWGDFDDIG